MRQIRHRLLHLVDSSGQLLFLMGELISLHWSYDRLCCICGVWPGGQCVCMGGGGGV